MAIERPAVSMKDAFARVCQRLRRHQVSPSHEDQEYRLTVKYLSTEAVDQLNSAGFFFKLQASYYFVGCNIAIFHEAVDPQRKSELFSWKKDTLIMGSGRWNEY